jgi:hypothetical protein
MATYINIDYAESQLLEQNRRQVDANRLNSLEEREQRDLVNKIQVARQGQERITRGRLRRGNREQLAAVRVIRSATENYVNEVFQHKSGEPEWRDYLYRDNVTGYYTVNPLLTYEQLQLLLYWKSIPILYEGMTPEEQDQAYTERRQLLISIGGGSSYESRIRWIVLNTRQPPYNTSYYQETATGALAAQISAKKNIITVTGLTTTSSEYPSVPSVGQRLKMAGSEYLIANASLTGVNSYKITLDHGLQSSASAGSLVQIGYTVIVQYFNTEYAWYNIITNQIEGLFEP